MTESETAEARLKRLQMRSARRGIKEMDLILGAFARDRLAGMSEAQLADYDALLWENDQDLYQWVTGQMAPPDRYDALISAVSRHAGVR
ncbi:MAG: succinate dehydrogenase assembly factor 2 [Rhodobacter sp.]|nr:succinate dehydrogenase assembly factor 2 [Rhodobacter sp.]